MTGLWCDQAAFSKTLKILTAMIITTSQIINEIYIFTDLHKSLGKVQSRQHTMPDVLYAHTKSNKCR